MIFSGIGAHGQNAPFNDRADSRHLCATRRAERCLSRSATALTRWKIIDKYGADALRFSLVTGNCARKAICVSPTRRSNAARNFANKIWNAARFVLMNL